MARMFELWEQGPKLEDISRYSLGYSDALLGRAQQKLDLNHRCLVVEDYQRLPESAKKKIEKLITRGGDSVKYQVVNEKTFSQFSKRSSIRSTPPKIDNSNRGHADTILSTSNFKVMNQKHKQPFIKSDMRFHFNDIESEKRPSSGMIRAGSYHSGVRAVGGPNWPQAIQSSRMSNIART